MRNSVRPEQISQPTQNTTVPAPQVIAPYASELDGGASYTTAGPQIENEPYRLQKQGRRQLLTTAYRSHLWGLIWTVIILILLALLAGIGMKLVGKYRKAPTITNSDGLTSVSAPTGLLGNQLLTVNGQLKVTGLTTLQSGLKVTGATNLQNDVSVGGNLNVAQNAAVTGTLTAGGLRVLGGVSAPTFQGGNFTGGAVNVTTITAAGTISGGSFTGNGSGLTGVNATLLNGQQGSYYLNASNISGGVLGIQYGGTGATTSAGARANLGAAAAGANNDITSLSGLTTALSASQGGTGVDGSTAGPGQILIGNGSGYSLANLTQGSGISITNASGSITIGVDSTVCTTAGNCGTGSGGGITGSGSADTIAMFTGAGSTLGNSLLSQSGSTVSVLGNLSASGSFTATSGTFSGAVSAGSVSTTGAVTAASANVSGNVTAGSFTGNGAGVTNVNAALLNGQAGSYYTNASNLSTGTVADARLSTNVTLQGNTFNGPNQLVQLTATGALPALDGSNVSNVNAASLQGYAASYFTDASNLSSGTLADARLSSNVPLKNTNNTFTGSNTFAGVAATSVSAVSILQNGNTVCDMSGNCAGVGGGVTTSGGTAGVLPVFTGAGSIANSLVSQAGSTVTVAGTLVATALQGSGAGLTSLNGSNIASGLVAVAYGGTGSTSYTTNGINYYDGSKITATAAGTSGQCLVATTGSAPSWQSCSAAAGTPSALAGDVTGPLSSNTVSNLQGSTLTLTTPAAGNFLLFDGAAWVNQSISGDATVSSAGALTVANSAITSAKILDATITAADIAAGTITGSNIASGSVTGSNIAGSTITGSNIAAGTVANGNLVNSSLTVTAGTGLTGGGSVALGGSTTLQVSYGNTAGTAVAGNTTLICPSGTGNLTG
ncbi:hypothetical protein KC976_03760, partial [Candidatus Saccharibacteria bacterium]|nr:hypothetical protein [Candidatus Saccharibacteria bacterium]